MKLSREIKTGIIVIGGILLFILGFSYLKSNPIFNDSKVYYAVYDHIGGLQTGTQVSINGFSVGKVNDIRFKDVSGKLVVTFTVDKSFDFSENSIAELYDTGIIGGKGIQIIPVFDGASMAKSGDTLIAQIRPGITKCATIWALVIVYIYRAARPTMKLSPVRQLTAPAGHGVPAVLTSIMTVTVISMLPMAMARASLYCGIGRPGPAFLRFVGSLWSYHLEFIGFTEYPLRGRILS